MSIPKSYKVTIDGVPNTFTYVYSNGNGDIQYNTEGNRSAYTFRGGIERFPKNKPIKTHGIILIILEDGNTQ